MGTNRREERTSCTACCPRDNFARSQLFPVFSMRTFSGAVLPPQQGYVTGESHSESQSEFFDYSGQLHVANNVICPMSHSIDDRPSVGVRNEPVTSELSPQQMSSTVKRLEACGILIIAEPITHHRTGRASHEPTISQPAHQDARWPGKKTDILVPEPLSPVASVVVIALEWKQL